MKKAEECLNLIQSLESRIRKGLISSVQKELQDLNIREVPREHVISLANLARRVGLTNKTLSFLNKIVRPENTLQTPATHKEKAEYAVALQKMGAIKEAMDLLKEVDKSIFPEQLLYTSFCLFAQWDYKEALPLLREFVESDELSEYMRTVGRVNLAAALVIAKENDEAEKLLALLEKHAVENELNFLYGNIMELSAQLSVNRNDMNKARGYLDNALRQFKDFDSPDSLFVHKWLAIVECLEKDKVTDNLHRIIEKASSYGHWETLRHCDLIIATLTGHRDQLEKVYFGTPHTAYRQKILDEVRTPWEPPDHYIYKDKFKNTPRAFDLELGDEQDLSLNLPNGQLIHQLLILLFSDLYKPTSLGRLHSYLFDGEYFNPFTSPDRIYQLMKRLKIWLGENQVPVEVHSSSGGYLPQLTKPYGILIPKDPLPYQATGLGVRKLGRLVGQEFSGKQAREKSGVKLSSMNRLLNAAMEEGLIEKLGNGPKTRYKIK